MNQGDYNVCLFSHFWNKLFCSLNFVLKDKPLYIFWMGKVFCLLSCQSKDGHLEALKFLYDVWEGQ